jgi:prepilin-type N-terminal cleavage/methylation domain-containing protein
MLHARTNKATSTDAFTLIELLIVVAIIAILAAVAVPNFLEAQVRAKVTRVKTDMRTISVGCESYLVDHNTYPTEHEHYHVFIQYITQLSTPLAYLTSLDLTDPFTPRRAGWATKLDDFRNTYNYQTYHGVWGRNCVTPYNVKGWVAVSFGPDMDANTDGLHSGGWIPYYWCHLKKFDYACNMIYDPTNGTKSGGNIIRCGGGFTGIDQVIGGE